MDLLHYLELGAILGLWGKVRVLVALVWTAANEAGVVHRGEEAGALVQYGISTV